MKVESLKNNHTIPKSSHHIRGSVLLLSFQVFISLFVIDTIYAGILIFFLLSQYATDYHAFVFSLLWLLHTAKFLLQTYVLLFLISRWATSTYYIYDHELVHYQGVLVPTESVYELNYIKTVSLQENWLGRLLNYGNIALTISSSGYREDIHLESIADPKKYERIFRQYMEESERRFPNGESQLPNPPARTQ